MSRPLASDFVAACAVRTFARTVRLAALQKHEEPGHRQQAEAHHQHAGDGARLEGEVEALSQALLRGDSCAHIGAHRHVHADVARRARQRRADQEAEGHLPAERKKGDDEDDDADGVDGHVLAVQVGAGAFLDGRRDFLHARIACAHGKHGADGPGAIKERQNARHEDEF